MFTIRPPQGKEEKMSFNDIGRDIQNKLFNKAKTVIVFGPDAHVTKSSIRTGYGYLFEDMRRNEIFVGTSDGVIHWAIRNIKQLVALHGQEVTVVKIVKIASAEVDRIIPNRV